jgi:hypothetical protein
MDHFVESRTLTAVFAPVLEQCFAGMLGIKSGLFNLGPNPLIICFQHGAHSSSKVVGRPRVISCRAVHEVQQPSALIAEFQMVNRPHVGRLADQGKRPGSALPFLIRGFKPGRAVRRSVHAKFVGDPVQLCLRRFKPT